MAELPVPAKVFFHDFSMDVSDYSVSRFGSPVGAFPGMPNEEGRRRYIAFLYGCDVRAGDLLVCGEDEYHVTKVETDTYRGEPSMVKAFY